VGKDASGAGGSGKRHKGAAGAELRHEGQGLLSGKGIEHIELNTEVPGGKEVIAMGAEGDPEGTGRARLTWPWNTQPCRRRGSGGSGGGGS